MNTSWKEKYTKDNRPERSALLDFWNPAIRQLFVECSNHFAAQYGLALTNLNYTKSHGWTFKFTKSGVVLIKKVIILEDSFYIDAIRVYDEPSMQRAFDYVASLYTPAFLEQFREKVETRNQKQSARAKLTAQREKSALEEILKTVPAEKLNQFRWSPKVPPAYLKRLYREDAKLLENEELADEVGYLFYARCLQGRDERLLANENKLKCHHCGAILVKTNSQFLKCECGYAYIFSEYMRSFNKNSMPSRSATPFFNAFIEKWPLAKSYSEKMRLIDWVIHECHLNMFSGVKRGQAGINLIAGSKQDVRDLIMALAFA